MNVTRQMLGAAHDVLLKRGLMLSGEMIEEIYLAMDALANHAETSGSLPSTPAAERPDHRAVLQVAYDFLTGNYQGPHSVMRDVVIVELRTALENTK